jgi:hypothetical protein
MTGVATRPVMFAYIGSELAKLTIAEAAGQLNHGREALPVTVWQPFNVGFGPPQAAPSRCSETLDSQSARTMSGEGFARVPSWVSAVASELLCHELADPGACPLTSDASSASWCPGPGTPGARPGGLPDATEARRAHPVHHSAKTNRGFREIDKTHRDERNSHA